MVITSGEMMAVSGSRMEPQGRTKPGRPNITWRRSGRPKITWRRTVNGEIKDER